MKIFENEAINIKRIVSVSKYETEKELDGKKYKSFNPVLPFYELIFVLTGEGKAYFNGVELVDCENSMRYLPKLETGTEYRVEKDENGFCIDIYFDTDSPMPSCAIGLTDMSEMKNSFLKIYNLWSAKKEGYYAKCMSVFYDIIAKLQKSGVAYLPSSQASKLDAAHEYLIENFKSRNFDYNALCGSSGLSYSYFKELFIAKYGMPPVKYLTYLRLEYAKELLITGRYSVGEIAEKCGFENVYYFSGVFKKSVGVSPKNYLKSI